VVVVSSYSIDAEKGLVRVRIKGRVTATDVIELTNRLYADPKFKTGMNSIVDLTEAEIAVEFSDSITLSRHLESVQEKRGPCRCAAVVPHPVGFAAANTVGLLAEDTAIDIQPFQNEAAATEWLAEPPE
jgi:hypothetical protein